MPHLAAKRVCEIHENFYPYIYAIENMYVVHYSEEGTK